jgi:hypothetical protein
LAERVGRAAQRRLSSTRNLSYPRTFVKTRLSHLACSFSILSLFAGSASAADWYVDAVNGSNSNDGTSPATAWLTIGHAVAQIPAGSERIFIAAGTYGPGIGEVFPIALKPGHQLIGAPGEPRPIVTANNATGSLLFRLESTTAQPLQFGADTRMEHLELRRAWRAIELVAQAGEVSPTLFDLRIERTVQSGLSIRGEGGACQPILEQVDIGVNEPTSNSISIAALGSAAPGITLRASDCVFAASGGGGVSLQGIVDAQLERCVFDGLGMAAIGVHADQGETLRLACVDTSITYCNWPMAASSMGGTVNAAFIRCTAATNAQPFNAVNFLPSGTLDLSFDSCIVVTEGPLLDGFGGPSGAPNLNATRSLISDGSFDGINGCFSGDPGFRNGADGDFRLRWGSPCVDAAFVNAPAGASDVVGTSRDLDGNLDTHGTTDLGAYEFQPLELTTTGAIGSTLTLENWGPNTLSTIYWARTGLASSQTTPFGAFVLHPQLARTFRVTTAGASAPNVTLRPIPNQIALVGHTFSFQALTDSPAAPLSKAFTNGVEFTVTP